MGRDWRSRLSLCQGRERGCRCWKQRSLSSRWYSHNCKRLRVIWQGCHSWSRGPILQRQDGGQKKSLPEQGSNITKQVAVACHLQVSCRPQYTHQQELRSQCCTRKKPAKGHPRYLRIMQRRVSLECHHRIGQEDQGQIPDRHAWTRGMKRNRTSSWQEPPQAAAQLEGQDQAPKARGVTT